MLVGVVVLLRYGRGWLMRSSANGLVEAGSSNGGVLIGGRVRVTEYVGVSTVCRVIGVGRFYGLLMVIVACFVGSGLSHSYE